MREKSTEELISIWVENNHKRLGQEELSAIERVLLERLGRLPEQGIKQEIETVPLISNKTTIDDSLGEPFFIVHLRAFLFGSGLFLIVLLCVGIIAALGKINDVIFWNFTINALPERIESIEIQEISDSNTKNNPPIIVKDKEAISHFVTALSTIQEYDPDQISGQHDLRIFVKLNAIETIEIDCFTIQGSNSIIVRSVFISPNFLAASVTTAIFPESDFHDWLISVGVNLQ